MDKKMGSGYAALLAQPQYACRRWLATTLVALRSARRRSSVYRIYNGVWRVRVTAFAVMLILPLSPPSLLSPVAIVAFLVIADCAMHVTVLAGVRWTGSDSTLRNAGAAAAAVAAAGGGTVDDSGREAGARRSSEAASEQSGALQHTTHLTATAR